MMQVPDYLKRINRPSEVRSGFIGRIAGVYVDTDREATLRRLGPSHQSALRGLGFSEAELHRAEQVHGSEIAMVEKTDPAQTWSGVDGLMTTDAGVLLGVYVADCGAVYISDPVRGILALLHSGKKGTEQNITGKAIAMMRERWGSRAEDLVVALAPCIRPPAYEVDFAAEIRRQVLAEGVPENQWTDSGLCTSRDLENYYSYRMEKGSTGRMLALLGRVAS
ncbi:MAG: polyphenol oxidase family protein [Verrucomicrobiae bacterium]|nr:polyphenol oxidase family protein [Verrucomicrobiae bacterium]NNJ43314.1 polyphenol oxidase family protein [Akkermansiaceae bacterium]